MCHCQGSKFVALTSPNLHSNNSSQTTSQGGKLISHILLYLLQGLVFLGHEFVSVPHVHLLLVLRHNRHGHRHLYLQIHRVLWVSSH